MKTAIEQIKRLRDQEEFLIEKSNTSRYYIDVSEENSAKTAYLFSTPIFKDKSGETVNMEFEKKGDKILFEGSNSIIFAEGDKFIFQNSICNVIVDLHASKIRLENGILVSDSVEIAPTLNGIKVKEKIFHGRMPTIDLQLGRIIKGIRDSSKSVSFMYKDFVPLITVSVIGIFNDSGDITLPGRLTYDKISDIDIEYRVNLNCRNLTDGEYFVYEINMHESKLFQDTTVESRNPYENNVFGSTAYIGKTGEFGDTWLYTKLDYSVLFQTAVQNIEGAYLYIPICGNRQINVKATCLKKRFCSFGSNWENKITEAEDLIIPSIVKGYYRFDITKYLVTSHAESHMLTYFDGLIIRAYKDENNFTTVSTADSCCNPQILEIKYK